MQLELPKAGLDSYHSASQRARVATEAWAATNLFCVNCESPRLVASPANTKAHDDVCPRCGDTFQLKSQSKPIANRVVDSAYLTMVQAIASDCAPHFFFLHYERNAWKVMNLLLIPRFALPVSAIERRKPLSPTARRAGWVGCNIVLTNIPSEARISIVANGAALRPAVVRRCYNRIRPLAALSVEERGWTLDVLNAVRSLGRPEFSLDDAYSAERRLAALHPSNRHVRDKIRQQLQVLRDKHLLEFLGRGRYRLA